MNYSQLKNAIAEVIRTNGNEEITGEVLQYTLLEMVSVLGKDYQFAGVGTPLTDTTERDDNVAWILGRGTYENFGNPFTVAVDEIAVVKYDGTFTVEKIKTGVVVDSELTLEGTNPVEGGAIAREFAKMRAAGYIFAGIMTPTGTPPHEITEKIFYLCTQAGVYPNFDSIVLDRGLNILKWNGSRWSADLVFAITDDVTEGLASLLTSAGAYAAIAAEAQLRQDGDAAVQQNIDAVEALIPSQASVDNKLVDERKMNSSIATATATYRGAYNQVSNLNLGVDATHEQVALALASQMTYLHITPDNNDYCYVLVPTSAETPTEIAHIDRYKYNGTAWGYEYTLNNSGYTAEQWAAINSGITSGLVAKLGALPTAQELAAALLTKQDVLTFDQAPTPSSTNPVTSGGVYTAIDDEKGARVNADAALQQAIEAILLLIPSAATALNQLADKAFVNSSIATATATFRGTFNLVSDLQLTVDATHADIAAALLNAISSADNNDYAFVQIPTSVDTPTEIRVTERYKFNGTAWAYEYDLNNSGFTAAQWAAINSGITALLVTKLSNLPNATELAALFAGKQNVLTFDNAPVSGSDNPVKSGGLYNLFAAIDAKIPTGASANNKLVAEDRLAAYVGGIIGALDATFNLTSADGHVTLRMTQTDGVITALQILTSDIASASALTTLGGQVSTNADDIAALQALYNALQQSAPQIIEPTDTWPVASPSDTVIYRVIDRVNTPPQYYSDYMWNGTTMVLMATYNNAIDPRPKKASQNLVTSGGVFDNMGALDVSELNATENPHALAQYVDLSAALAAVPIDYQKGGMSIKFVQSSDNKYMQYRLMADSFSTNEADWQGTTNTIKVGNRNLVDSDGICQLELKFIGKIEYNGRLNTGALYDDGKLYENHDGWYTTDFIFIKNGQKFISTAYNYLIDTQSFPNMCVYSSSNEDSFTSCILAQDHDGFEYTAVQDCFVRFTNLGANWINPILVQEGSPIDEMKNGILSLNSRLNETKIYPKLILYTGSTSYGYLTTGGVYNSATDFWVTTDFIHLSKNMCIKSYKANRNVSASYPNCSVYKTNNQNSFIRDVVAREQIGFEYIATEDCYVRFCNSEDNFELYISDAMVYINETYEQWIKKLYLSSVNLTGKKIGFLGDSITAEGSYTTAFADMTGADVINYGVSGSRISTYIASGDSFIERVPDMSNELDIIVVFGGVNDQRSNVPLGVFENRNTDGSLNGYFYGALHTLCRELFAKYAGKPIVFITPMHNSYRDETYGDTGDYNYYEYNTNGLLIENKFPLRDKIYVDETIAVGDVLSKYRQAIIDVCALYSFPVIDLYAISGFFPIIPQNATLYTRDGIHPNATGGIQIAKVILPYIEKLVIDNK